MSGDVLKLEAAHGDMTLGHLRYVLHRAGTTEASVAVGQEGLLFVEGQAVASTDLATTLGGYTEAAPQSVGLTFLVAVPPMYTVGCSIFSDVIIDRAQRQVRGYPMTYAASRDRLAFYREQEAEMRRKTVEHEVEGGYDASKRPSYLVEPWHLAGFWRPDVRITGALDRLTALVSAYETVEFASYYQAVRDGFQPLESYSGVMPAHVTDGIVDGTIEAAVMKQLRLMRWRGLKAQGYTYREGDQPVAIPEVELAQHAADIEALRSKVGERPFPGSLTWLNDYAAQELHLMNAELQGA